MKKKQILFFACCLALGSSTMDLCAQRTMDKLGRGLVATVTQSGSGNFVSWRVLGEEYYDVAYNLYANGELVAKGLSASNYVHTGGTAETRYTVAPVVKGKEGEQCDPVKRFKEFSFYSLTGQNTGFLRVPGAEMKGRNGGAGSCRSERRGRAPESPCRDRRRRRPWGCVCRCRC